MASQVYHTQTYQPAQAQTVRIQVTILERLLIIHLIDIGPVPNNSLGLVHRVLQPRQAR